ncbi:MAG: alpha-glucan family phosphorylase [Fimbriimonas sp.]|nr:alpha-glucan family phosphorylase [Fimbriimonas sp.]
MKNPKFSHAFEVVNDLPPRLQPLKTLASNYLWTWEHEIREIFRVMDREEWDASDHNPILFLNRISKERLSRLEKDTAFIARIQRCVEILNNYLTQETWFDRAYPGERDRTTIAYFCAEFGISEGLPIYSGGLGVLAGDHLKAASDLGIPLVGVGLLYNRGSFRQRLNFDGWQQEVYPEYDFYQMPLTLIRNEADQPLRIEVEFPDRVVTCQVWKAMVGRIPLYLLDSNVLDNLPADQGITDTLYGGDEEMRIRQEMILGIGGMRALKAVGIQPTVCHMNEGHAAFLSIERIRQFMIDNGCDFRTARQVIVNGNVFTTHTPVPAGFDIFVPHLLERYMGKSIESVGLGFSDFVSLGRIDPSNHGEAFNMAVLAMENADYVNGVSKLHAKVTRTMFSPRWPGFPEDEVPVQAVTNGIHTMTWMGRRMASLLDRYCGHDWRRNPENRESWEQVMQIPDEDLWAVLEDQRGSLVRFVRKRLQRDIEQRTLNRADDGILNSVLDPRVLTIGFARRFATYKRGSLMLTDRDRLKKILCHPERPIQIIISGKSHPKDDGGKRIIQDLVRFINDEALTRIVFLEDYDMQVGRALVQGVDVWLNNPRRPHEASGTSGMKVVPNGGLNCSILDGWWDEGYDSSVGWAIGDRSEVQDEVHQDWLDSRSLYHLLQNEISPMFYHRVENGVPRGWVQMVKRSMIKLAPEFTTSRMVREYTEKFYVPSANAYSHLASEGLVHARRVLNWRDRVQGAWSNVRIVRVEDTASRSNPLGREISIQAAVYLGGLHPDDVQVEALVGRIGPNREISHCLVHPFTYVGNEGDLAILKANIVCENPGHQGYTVRVVPRNSDISVPSELSLVTWE